MSRRGKEIVEPLKFDAAENRIRMLSLSAKSTGTYNGELFTVVDGPIEVNRKDKGKVISDAFIKVKGAKRGVVLGEGRVLYANKHNIIINSPSVFTTQPVLPPSGAPAGVIRDRDVK